MRKLPWFRYSAEQWNDIHAALIPDWPPKGKLTTGMRQQLEFDAKRFLAYVEFWTQTTGHSNAFTKINAWLRKSAALIKQTPLAKDAARITAIADKTTPYMNQGRRGRPPDLFGGMYIIILLNRWKACGHAIHPSVNEKGRGGPLIRFLIAATEPVFTAAGRNPPTATALRAMVRRQQRLAKTKPDVRITPGGGRLYIPRKSYFSSASTRR